MSEQASESPQKIFRVKTFCARHPDFTERIVRDAIFNRHQNGLAPAFIFLGQRVFVDEEQFFQCLRELNAPCRAAQK